MRKLIPLIVLFVVVISCQKEISWDIILDPGTGNPPNPSLTFDKFFKDNAAPIQKFTSNSSNPVFCNTSKGCSVFFADNSFVTLNNIPVTGDVTIEIKEILTPADMILNNTPTQSNGQPLESGGEFFVKVTKNNEILKLAPGKFIMINVPVSGTTVQGMQVFSGDTSSGSVNWVQNSSQRNFVMDSVNSYSLFSDSLSWINIDKFMSEPRISYSIEGGNSPNTDSTAVFIHLTGRNSVLRFPKVGTKFHSDLMIAAPATIVGLCVVNGKLYYSFAPVTMQHNGTHTLNMVQATEAEVKQKLATLK